MKRKSLFLLILLFFSATAMSGCLMESDNVFRVESKDLLIDNGTKTILIASDRADRQERQIEIKEKLEQQVNGGSLNIIRVRTSYFRGFLNSARISYNSTGPGKGNAIRAIILLNNDEERDEKMKEIVENKNFDIAELHRPNNYEDAAVVYYTIKQ